MFKVCISCSTYNHSAYITDAMNGFCKQKTSFPFVCCIIDDNSTDGEQEVIRNYLNDNFDMSNIDARRRVTVDYEMFYVRHKINTNCFFAVYFLKYNHYQILKNKKVYISEWTKDVKYYAACEGDDYWTVSNKLEKQIGYMEKHPECVLTFSNAYFVRPDSSIRWLNTISVLLRIECQNIEFKFHKNMMAVLLKNGNILQTASVCFRNHEKEWANFRKEIPFKMLMGDKPRWLYYCTLGEFKCFHSFMSAYRILPESASHTRDYNKAMKYRDNSEQVARYFNNRFEALPEKKLDKLYRISACRKRAAFSKTEFLKLWKELLHDYPSQIFNIRLNIIAFFRIFFNRNI